jgi:hypothetical protein
MVAVVSEPRAPLRPFPLELERAHARTSPSVRVAASTYRRRRAVAAGLLAAFVLVVLSALGTLGGGPRSASERPSVAGPSAASQGRLTASYYVVQPGDTFWSIARRVRPDADPRPLVDKMVAAHHGATLHVGERIPLPA